MGDFFLSIRIHNCDAPCLALTSYNSQRFNRQYHTPRVEVAANMGDQIRTTKEASRQQLDRHDRMHVMSCRGTGTAPQQTFRKPRKRIGSPWAPSSLFTRSASAMTSSSGSGALSATEEKTMAEANRNALHNMDMGSSES